MWKVSRCKTAHGRVRSSLFHVCCLYYFPGLAAAKATWRHFSFIDAMVSEICASAWLFLISLTVCVQNVNKRIFIDLQATLKWCLGVHEHCQMWCQHPTTSTNVQDYELWHCISVQSINFICHHEVFMKPESQICTSIQIGGFAACMSWGTEWGVTCFSSLKGVTVFSQDLCSQSTMAWTKCIQVFHSQTRQPPQHL